MQQTLSYMTKLDRAIDNQRELLQLSKFYHSINVSPTDLFGVLKQVVYSKNSWEMYIQLDIISTSHRLHHHAEI